MAGRSQLPNPTRSSTRLVSSVVRTVVEPSPPSCPGMSRLPRASGLRPPRSYGSAPPAPCSPQIQSPRPSRLRTPQGRSGIRPPQATGLRSPRPVCRPPQRTRTPSPPRARSPSPPCAPSPCAPPPCAPVPCPAASSPRAEDMSPCERLLTEQSEEEAAVRAAMRAQWQATRAAYPDTMTAQLRRVEQRRCAAREQQRQLEARRAQERAQLQLRQMQAAREMLQREYEEQCHGYNMTLEAIEEMLMEERDLMLREQTERLLCRAAPRMASEAQWRAAVGLAEQWRRDMLEAYRPNAIYQAQIFANRELWEKRKKKYRAKMRLPRQPLSPLRESQVDVFDDSPPCAIPLPLLPERVFDVPPPCEPLTLMDFSPPWDSDLPPPLMRSFTESPAAMSPEEVDDWYLEFDSLRDARRELTFDSEDDDSMLEGAVGGACM